MNYNYNPNLNTRYQENNSQLNNHSRLSDYQQINTLLTPQSNNISAQQQMQEQDKKLASLKSFLEEMNN